MGTIDIQALERLAEGDGEIRVTKRWLRGIVAQLKAQNTAQSAGGRMQDIFDRMYGSQRG
jgi:hypothetical protein